MVGLMAQSLSQFQACPSPPGICHFLLEKLQMPHGGAGRSYKKPIQFLKQGPVYKKEGPDSSKGSNKQQVKI